MRDEIEAGDSTSSPWCMPERLLLGDVACRIGEREQGEWTRLRKGCADRGKQGDPAGDIVRHLRKREEADQPLVRGLRPGRGAARERVEFAQPAASGSKHLCGQTCLHKLVDDFMAKALTARPPQAAVDEAEDEIMEQAVETDTSLTSRAASRQIETSARLAKAPKPTAPAKPAEAPANPLPPPIRMPMELIVVPARPRIEET